MKNEQNNHTFNQSSEYNNNSIPIAKKCEYLAPKDHEMKESYDSCKKRKSLLKYTN